MYQLLEDLGRPVPKRPDDTTAIDARELARELIPMIYDEASGASVSHDVQFVYRVGFGVRDRISLDAWRILTRLRDRFVRPSNRRAIELTAVLELLNESVQVLDAFSGQSMEGMTRERGWRFLDIGRRIERAINLIALLRYGLGKIDALEPERLATLLEITNSLMTFRSRYLSSVEPTAVLDLLLQDETNPRSLAYQCARIQDHVMHLAPSLPASQRPREVRIAMGLLATAQLADADELTKVVTADRRTGLAQQLDWMNTEFIHLANALTNTYLSHARPARAMTDFGIEQSVLRDPMP